MHECKDEVSLKIQDLNSQIKNKDSRIEKLNVKIWDQENRYNYQMKEQKSQIQDQLVQILEYKDLIRDKTNEIDQLKHHDCDKCDFQTESISSLIMHLSLKHKPGNQNLIKCKDCGFASEKKADLKLHTSVKLSSKPAVIDMSKMRFIKSNLTGL